jgi:predicted metal-dependent hydrolase
MIRLEHLETIPFQDTFYQIEFSKYKFLKERVVPAQSQLLVYQSEITSRKHKDILRDWLRNKSKEIIKKRVIDLAQVHSFEVSNIYIKDQSSRWGSCSSNKNINMNWRLIFAPSTILDYVIIHELAHTKEMNHSKDFWNIVEAIVPEYRSYRKYLKEKGLSLSVN